MEFRKVINIIEQDTESIVIELCNNNTFNVTTYRNGIKLNKDTLKKEDLNNLKRTLKMYGYIEIKEDD